MLFKAEADLGQLSRIRAFVVDSAAALGVDPAAFDDIRLAVDEAVTNVLTHGYEGAGAIEVEILADSSDLVVRLRDKARPFDPVLAAPPDAGPPENREEPGGFGLILITRAMDELAYSALNPGNELMMIKRNVVKDSADTDPERCT